MYNEMTLLSRLEIIIAQKGSDIALRHSFLLENHRDRYLGSFQRFKELVPSPHKKVRNYKSLTSSIVKPVMSAIISNAKP